MSVKSIIKFVSVSFGVIFLLYSVLYLYYRNDGWIDHDTGYEYVNYSKGFVYDGHKIKFSRIYENDPYFAPIDQFTRPGRWAESKFWELRQPKGASFPEDWKLPNPDNDWKIVLELGKSRSPTAFSKLEAISQKNQDLPSGKLASLMTELWDHRLRTFFLDKPRAVVDTPYYAIRNMGHYDLKFLVRPDGKVKKVRVMVNGLIQAEAEDVVRHQLFCPAKNEKAYIEAELAYMIFACG